MKLEQIFEHLSKHPEITDHFEFIKLMWTQFEIFVIPKTPLGLASGPTYPDNERKMEWR